MFGKLMVDGGHGSRVGKRTGHRTECEKSGLIFDHGAGRADKLTGQRQQQGRSIEFSQTSRQRPLIFLALRQPTISCGRR
jgi:hypothetical protein